MLGNTLRPDMWNQLRNPQNYGIPGAQASNLLYFLRTDFNLWKVDPKRVVLLIGTNEIHSSMKVDEIFHGIQHTYFHLVRTFPFADVYICTLYIRMTFFGNGYFSSMNAKVEAVKALIHMYIFPGNIIDYYADFIWHKELMSEMLHPNSDGHQIMTSKINSLPLYFNFTNISE
jgi:hypothetical protein